MPDEFDYKNYKSIEDFGKTLEGSKYYHDLYLKAVNHPMRREILKIINSSNEISEKELFSLLMKHKILTLVLTLILIPNFALAARSKYARPENVDPGSEEHFEKVEKEEKKEDPHKNDRSAINQAIDERYRFQRKYQSEIVITGGRIIAPLFTVFHYQDYALVTVLPYILAQNFEPDWNHDFIVRL